MKFTPWYSHDHEQGFPLVSPAVPGVRFPKETWSSWRCVPMTCSLRLWSEPNLASHLYPKTWWVPVHCSNICSLAHYHHEHFIHLASLCVSSVTCVLCGARICKMLCPLLPQARPLISAQPALIFISVHMCTVYSLESSPGVFPSLMQVSTQSRTQQSHSGVGPKQAVRVSCSRFGSNRTLAWFDCGEKAIRFWFDPTAGGEPDVQCGVFFSVDVSC